MKILIISAFFYPQNVIAVSRVGQWAKYFSKFGHEVTVLTTKKYSFWPLDYNVKLPENINIVEVDYLKFFGSTISSYFSSYGGAEKNENKRKVIGKFFGVVKSLILKFFDPHDFWIMPASNLNRKILGEDIDVIISSYSPAAAHHIARNIKLKNKRAIWIADFRDLWSNNHLSEKNFILKFFEQLREKYCIKKSDILITVSKPLARSLEDSYPNKKVFVVPNGFDPEDHSDWFNSTSANSRESAVTRISYTGMIYKGKRDPIPLFVALNNLIDSGLISKDDFSLDFYGPNKNILEDIINSGNFNRHGLINLHDQVSKEKSLLIQKESDILLLLESPSTDARGVLTGKLFEYIVSGRPILAVGVHPESEAGILINNAKVGVALVCVNAIQETLLEYHQHKKFLSFNPNFDEISKYSRDRQVNSIIEIIKNFQCEKNK